MITTILTIIKVLLSCGIAGLLIIVGAIAVIIAIVKSIISRIYLFVRTQENKLKKGGNEK